MEDWDSDTRTTKLLESFEAFGKAGIYYMLVMLLGAIISLTVLAASLVPFDPFTFYGYSVVPTQACPSETLTVTADSEMEDSPLYNVEAIEVEGQWVRLTEGNNATTYGSASTIVDAAPYERRERESSLLRIAPEAEGEYILSAEITVHGKVLGLFEREQVEIISDEDVVVTVNREHC